MPKIIKASFNINCLLKSLSEKDKIFYAYFVIILLACYLCYIYQYVNV